MECDYEMRQSSDFASSMGGGLSDRKWTDWRAPLSDMLPMERTSGSMVKLLWPFRRITRTSGATLNLNP